MMLHMIAPDLGFGGGWDPESRRLYIVYNNSAKVHQQIAAGITDAKLAALLVEMWCKGYRAKQRELTLNPNVNHFHILAEGEHYGEVEKVVVDENSTTEPPPS